MCAKATRRADRTVDHVYRWDLDKTYLKTDFDTVRDLLRTAMQRPEDKENVPGAVQLLRELTGPETDRETFVTFISGSPSQMRSTLERKFELDGIEPDVFVLKPTLRYILRGRFAAIRGQVGYKLDRLLMLRNEGPAAPETLFGDDAEQDAFIYSLYADLAAGRVRPDYLRRVLAEADVHPKAADSIAGRAAAIDVRDNVDRIFIHLEQRTPPGRFWVFGPRVVPIANYFQAAFILFTRGALTAPGAVRVGRGMVEGHGFGIRELADSLEDLFRRRHLEVDELERFREGLREWEDTPDEVLDFADEFIDRARNLAPLETETPHRATGPPDYIDLLRSDRALRESVRDEAG